MTATLPGTKFVQHIARLRFRSSPVPAGVRQDGEQEPVHFGPERRREVRYRTCDAVQVSALDVAGFQVQGVLRDVSRNGLCVELGLPVEPGARLQISLRDHTIVLAAVCYCRKTTASYQVGAAIKGVYQSNPDSTAVSRRPYTNIWHIEPGPTPESNNMHPSQELARAMVEDTLLFAGHGSFGAPPVRLNPVREGTL